MALSVYATGLDPTAKGRYEDKIGAIGVDPYVIPKQEQKSVVSSTVEELPDLTYHDIYNYFLNSASPITGEALKAYKSLEAYKFFISGFVRDIFNVFGMTGPSSNRESNPQNLLVDTGSPLSSPLTVSRGY